MNKPSGKKLPFSSKFLYKKFQYKIAFFPVNLHLKNPVKYYFFSGIIFFINSSRIGQNRVLDSFQIIIIMEKQ